MKREHTIDSKGNEVTYLEYLQSNNSVISNLNGGQYIDTLLQPYYIEAEIKVAAVTNPEKTDKLQGACGCWNANNNRYYVVEYTATTSAVKNGIWFANKSNSPTQYITSYDLLTPHIYLYNSDNNKCYIDGTQIGSVNDITSQNLAKTITLFGIASQENQMGCTCSSWRIYYAKFRNKTTNEIVGYFKPALDGNGAPCMYDEITQSFFYNKGTGEFTYA